MHAYATDETPQTFLRLIGRRSNVEMSANCSRRRTKERLNTIIRGFLERNELLGQDSGWEVRESEVGGFGVFANRDFDVGEVIFRDLPVIIGPRCLPNCPKLCVRCLSKTNLHPCRKRCGLEVCSDACESSPQHLKECKIIRQCHTRSSEITTDFQRDLYENLTPIKSLLLDERDKEVVSCLVAHDRDQHGHEIDTLKGKLGFEFKEDDEKFMRFVCCVLDANAFEVVLGNEDSHQSSLRGLYPLGSLANHSCVPNTLHVFNDKQQMIAKAAVFIPKDSEIFHSYTRIIWGTTTRLYHLYKTKHFICKCARCRDPTEFGTYMGSVLCKLCRGIVSPVNPYKAFGRWQCRDCRNVILGKDTGDLTTLLGTVLKNIRPDDFPFMHKFLTGKLRSVVPENNQVATELKSKILWVLGHKPGYKWNELPLELLELKEQICTNLLTLLETLRCGQSKMRGLLIYELFCCKRETINRVSDSKPNLIPDGVIGLLNEAASILKYDIAAPDEIKTLTQ